MIKNLTSSHCFKIRPLVLLMTLSAAFTLTACGGAETTIVELDPIPAEEDEHDHDGESDGALGRLVLINSEENTAEVYNLEDSELLTTITLDALPSAVYASGGYRYASLIERSADKVSFIDGGLWQEAHNDHFDVYETMPIMSNFTLTGSRPTHFVPHDGSVAVFFDGDSSSSVNSSIQVFDDDLITAAGTPASVEFDVAMHGVAEPRGEYLLATLRRDDADTSSTNTLLPDQVGVFHLHDNEYELEQTFDETCADLHGAAQNENYVVYGCSDGVLLAVEGADEVYSAVKLSNPEAIAESARIGSIWGHEESAQFIALASVDGQSQFFTIDPDEQEIELIDWQALSGAVPVGQDFAYEAEQFVILDDQGYLTLIEPHDENGHVHWEFGTRLDITEADVSLMPEGMKFSMTLAQNGHQVYIADPILKHVVVVDLDLLETDEIELGYAPSSITWLGIAEEH